MTLPEAQELIKAAQLVEREGSVASELDWVATRIEKEIQKVIEARLEDERMANAEMRDLDRSSDDVTGKVIETKSGKRYIASGGFGTKAGGHGKVFVRNGYIRRSDIAKVEK
jgi:hypothetical protein